MNRVKGKEKWNKRKKSIYKRMKKQRANKSVGQFEEYHAEQSKR